MMLPHHVRTPPQPATIEPPMLDVNGLTVTVNLGDRTAVLLDNVSVEVSGGEIHGLVGETGCGKSTFIKSLLAILPPSCRVTGGRIVIDGHHIETGTENDLRALRGGLVALIPQDPYQALNPVFTIGGQLLPAIGRVLARKAGTGASRLPAQAREVLLHYIALCHVRNPAGVLQRYPHEFSGGQLQRILISAALACKPRLLLADEPTSALDVTTQREITQLIRRMARSENVTTVFVSHDLELVSEICDRVSVMYCGQIVEVGSTDRVLTTPANPYTGMLLACHPDHSERPSGIPGLVPQLRSLPPGCRFASRCPSATDECARRPDRLDIGDDHAVSCWLYPVSAKAAT